MEESNKEKIEKLTKQVENLTVNLNAINYNLSKYKDLSSLIIQTESINKIRRYGEKEYLSKFAANPSRNVSSFMRPFLYTQAMEKKLLEKRVEIFNEINKVKFEIKLLEDNKNE